MRPGLAVVTLPKTERRPLPTDGAPDTSSALARISPPGSRRKPRPAYVSLWAPAGRRRLWVYAYRCGECDTYQFGRRRSLADVTEVRKGGCGHLIEVVIARVYGGQEAS